MLFSLEDEQQWEHALFSHLRLGYDLSQFSMRCPSCHSDEQLSLSKLHEDRKQKELAAQLFGQAEEDGPDLGGVAAQKRARQLRAYQAQLSKSVAPPPEKRSPVIWILSALALVSYLAQNHWFWSVVLLLIAVYFVYQDHLYKKHVFPREFEKWRKSVICARCGAIYLPREVVLVNPEVDFEQLLLDKHNQFATRLWHTGRAFLNRMIRTAQRTPKRLPPIPAQARDKGKGGRL